ncbi:MAG: insulinase family protein, partial [Myxococcota bacterium]
LLSALKAEGLATSLSAGLQNESYRGIFGVDMELTEAGMAKVERVVELVLGYVAMLREQGLSERYYREQQVVGDLDFYFREHQTGGDGASFLTGQMRNHPGDAIERRLYTFTKYDPDLFAEYVALLRPDNMRVIRIAEGLETDAVEPYYGTKYANGTWPAETVARWAAAKPTEAMHLPPVNPYLPDDISLLANDPNEGPYTILNDERGEFWFEQDRRFKLPRAHVSVLMETPAVNRTPRSRLVAELYVRAIREGLNEWAYLVREAGLGLNLSSERRGISMYVNGYAQRIPTLMADVADRLDDVVIDETAFAAIKEELAREYANRHLELAVRQAFYEVSLVLDPHGIHRDDYADMVDAITLDEVKAFADTVYDEVRVEGVAYGNLEARALEQSIGTVLTALGAEPLADDARPPEASTIQLPSGRTALVRENGTDNHSWVRWVEFGPRDPRTEAILRLGSTHFSSRYYSELRTRQQLGYIVGSSASLTRDGMGMNYYLQSGEYDASTLGDRADTFLAEAVPTFRDLDDEAFAALQQSVIDTLQQQEESMGDRLGTIDFEAFRLDGDFAWDDKVVAEVKNVTREDVTKAFEAALDAKQGKSFVVYLDAQGAKASTPADPIADKEAFRKGRPTF